MPLHVLLLVLASAVVHVAWNVLARSAHGSARFAWLANVAGAALLLPGFLARRVASPIALDGGVIGLAAWSALFETAYFVLLHRAYAVSELSIVYPLSRGIAPLFALVPARLWTGDAIDGRELLGIAVVLVGAACVASSAAARLLTGDSVRDAPAARRARSGVWLALAAGATTAAYQLVDRKAMQLVARGAELDYLFEMQLVLAALMTAWWWAQRAAPAPPMKQRRGEVLPDELLPHSRLRVGRDELRRAVLAALAIQVAYYLVLLALRDGNVALVSSARNVGIPLSLLAAASLLGERLDAKRIAGSLLIVAGILLTC
jgi:drug/metabolite transporter (DMT)-like permease